jgi:Peptidase family S41
MSQRQFVITGPLTWRLASTAAVIACAASATPAPAQEPFDGSWRSEGYGLYFEITGPKMTAYEVTAISCIPSYTATRKEATAGGVVFTVNERPTTLVVRETGSPGTRRLHLDFAASDIVIQKTGARPQVCATAPRNTPSANFDVFARTWAEHYPFFALKRADWRAIVASHRRQVTDKTTPDKLFEILRSMVEPFEDAHTNIRAETIKKSWSGTRKSPTWLERDQRARAFEIVEQNYLSTPLRSWCNGQVQYGRLGSGAGYLRLKSFSGYGSEPGFASGLAALEAALDTIFADAPTWPGLVIDVRINGGGSDLYRQAIASRLATEDYIGYSKEARADPDDPTRWTPGQPSWVRRSTRPGFRGPVIVLTGIHSVSAAETFTQAGGLVFPTSGL